uniref:Proteoglycan 4b n=1 Tax=Myripristis murdjan TaxID=586833 RepID=A0A667W9T6_9TELE
MHFHLPDASVPEKQSDPTSLSDSETTPPQPSLTTTAVPHVSGQPTPTSVPQTGPTSPASTPEFPSGQAEIQPDGSVTDPAEKFPDAQKLEPAEASSDQPEVLPLDPEKVDSLDTNQATSPATTPAPTQDSAPDLSETTPASPVTTSSKPDQTPIPEVMDPQDPSTTDSQVPGSEPGPDSGARGDTPGSWSGPGPQGDALTTRAPSPTDPAQTDRVDSVTPGGNTLDSVKVTPAPTKPKPSPTKPSQAKPPLKPAPKPLDPAQTLNIDSPGDYQADDSNSTNLCNGQPTSAITTLRNGTIVVFRGHYFWVLDSNRVPGPARGITEVWGVPSPIDTVFTRCNCQGKTYVFKGPQYWRFDNDVLDPGYPKLVQTGFDGLRGYITAALSVPQYQRRREAVYFFKRGGLVQKYSYQFGTTPTCGRKVQYAVYTTRGRVARQAAINIRTTWRGFPTTVTSAVSIPSQSVPEGYKYYVFSRSKYYNVKISGERPVLAANTTPQRNSANDFFKCPNKI